MSISDDGEDSNVESAPSDLGAVGGVAAGVAVADEEAEKKRPPPRAPPESRPDRQLPFPRRWRRWRRWTTFRTTTDNEWEEEEDHRQADAAHDRGCGARSRRVRPAPFARRRGRRGDHRRDAEPRLAFRGLLPRRQRWRRGRRRRDGEHSGGAGGGRSRRGGCGGDGVYDRDCDCDRGHLDHDHDDEVSFHTSQKMEKDPFVDFARGEGGARGVGLIVGRGGGGGGVLFFVQSLIISPLSIVHCSLLPVGCYHSRIFPRCLPHLGAYILSGG